MKHPGLVAVRIDPELHGELMIIAEQLGLQGGVSDLIREALAFRIGEFRRRAAIEKQYRPQVGGTSRRSLLIEAVPPR